MGVQKKSILLVDDSTMNLTLVNALLSNAYTLYTAISGARMFKLLKHIRPDLILLDIEMPEMDGYEVLRRLKSNAETADIPVVFLTAHDMEEIGQHSLVMETVGHITKPFAEQHLLSNIERIFIEQEAIEDFSLGISA